MNASSFAQCTWINPPASWTVDESVLRVTTDKETDFWRETHYGFIHDSGHFFGCPATGQFTAQLRFEADYSHLYDQAGMMIRIDKNTWIKTSIEFTDGKHALSTVVTAGKSDWSIGALEGQPGDVRLRVTVNDGTVRIQASSDGKHWPVFRVFSFPQSDGYRVGPMCCSPKRGGFQVRFSDFTIGPPTSKDLHDFS